MEKQQSMPGGIYHKVQIDLTYHSHHIEGSRLSYDQVLSIYETNTIRIENDIIRVDDIIETTNHFSCIDYIIDHVSDPLSESLIKEVHFILKSGTTDSRKNWFAVGGYKKLENEVGGQKTSQVIEVKDDMKELLKKYHTKKEYTILELIEFHYHFECIHPFQDGNGRVGKLILFKECLKHGIVPFIIEENLKFFYYRGLKEYRNEPGYLNDTCLMAQDKFKAILDYFGIVYKTNK